MEETKTEKISDNFWTAYYKNYRAYGKTRKEALLRLKKILYGENKTQH